MAPLNRANVDTDAIIPKQFLRRIERSGFGKNLFHEWRYLDYEGTKENPNFILNKPPYRKATVLLAMDNFGCGSSREHAAMSPRLLGAAAVIVRSFARIHESNLKKQGVLPLTLVDPASYDLVRETDRVSVLGLAELSPGSPLTTVLHHEDGTEDTLQVQHSLNEEQIEWFKNGSALNVLKKQKR